MTQLAVRNGSTAGEVVSAPHSVIEPSSIPLNDVWAMACWVHKGALWPDIKSPEAAMGLMLLCQADGMHPVHAMRRYHIAFGRFTMRADAMQAEFMQRGGRIKILEYTPARAAAEFTHPLYQPDGIEVDYTWDDAVSAGDVAKNPNYMKRPRQMLWARLITMALTLVDPGIKVGTITPEEAEDISPFESLPLPRKHEVIHEQARAAVAEADALVPGHDPRQPDVRAYHLVVTTAAEATNALVADAWGDAPDPPKPLDARVMHGKIAQRAVTLGHAEGPAPSKVAAAVAFASKVYASHRQWVRGEITAMCQDHEKDAAEAHRLAREAAARPEDESQECDPAGDVYAKEPGEDG